MSFRVYFSWTEKGHLFQHSVSGILFQPNKIELDICILNIVENVLLYFINIHKYFYQLILKLINYSFSYHEMLIIFSIN